MCSQVYCQMALLNSTIITMLTFEWFIPYIKETLYMYNDIAGSLSMNIFINIYGLYHIGVNTVDSLSSILIEPLFFIIAVVLYRNFLKRFYLSTGMFALLMFTKMNSLVK